MNKLFAIFLLVVVSGVMAQPTSKPDLKINPENLEIDFFYHGTELRIEATIPKDCQAVVKLQGETQAISLHKKGKRGPLWMNVETVTVEAPNIYLLAASSELADIAVASELAKYGLGFTPLEDMIKLECEDSSEQKNLIAEFIRVKRDQKLYGVSSNSINLRADNDKQKLRTTFSLPSSIAPGEYQVQLFCFKDGNLTAATSQVLTVQKVGIVKLITDLAFKHGASYGIFAIVVAISVGFIIGKLFKKR